MSTKIMARALALVVVLALAFGSVQAALAQGKGQLPEVKQPTSERFDIFGKLTISGLGPASDTTISGSGAISGNNAQVSFSTSSSGGLQQPGTPPSFSFEIITVDGKIYMKTSGLPGSEDQWYVSDSPEGASAGTPPFVGSLVPSDPALADAYTVTQVGKETIDGAPTTKYQIDVDTSKLLAGITSGATQGGAASPTSEPTQPDVKTDFKTQMFVWIGDTNSYLYQVTELSSASISSTNSSQPINVSSEVTMTIHFKDFDQPITITAPANAVPISQAGSGSSLAGLEGMATNLLGNPLGAGVAAGMPSTMSGMPETVAAPPVGMPRTGNQSAGSLWLPIVLGVTLIGAGSLISRRAARAR